MCKIITILFALIFSNVHGQKLSKKTKRYLKLEMDSISVTDQKYRWELMFKELNKAKLDSLKKLPKTNFWEHVTKAMKNEIVFSKSVNDSLWKLQNHLDSINANKFYLILQKYGYPSYNRIQSYTASSLSLHLMGEYNFNRFLEVFKKEVEKKNMPANEYAKWYDRNQLVQKKKQLYGEYNSLFPCVENINITNLERAKIGLHILRENKCE